MTEDQKSAWHSPKLNVLDVSKTLSPNVPGFQENLVGGQLEGGVGGDGPGGS